jgi:hypothetical protein
LAWKLKVNIDKTKIVCFTNGSLPQNLQFTYSNSEIEILKEFNYLGLLLTKTGNFKRAIKTLADKGTNAMYEILKRGKFHNLSISCQLIMFIYTFIIFSISCEIVRRPVTLWFSKKSSRSFKNIANKKGDQFTPCLLPLSHGN